MTLCKEILYFDGYMVYWFSGGEFHYVDDDMDVIKVVKPEDEYTYLLKLRGESL